MIRNVLAVLLVCALITSATPVAAEPVDPNFRTVVPSPTLTPGQVNEVRVLLLNDAYDFDDETATARNVEVRPRDVGRLDVLTGHLFVPSLSDPNASRPNAVTSKEITLSVRVPADIEAGTYRIPVELRYEWRGENGPRERDTTVYVPVRVEEGPRFAVVDVDSAVAVGGRGTLAVTMENVGEQAAADATMTLSARSADVSLGEGRQASRFVGSWAVGEARTFVFDAGVSPTARPGNYTLAASVSFTDPDGNDGASPNLSFGMTALPEQTFAIESVDSSLRVGEEGTLSGEVRNAGPKAVENVVVVLQESGATVTPIETEYAVGDLAPGESAPFSFDVEVSSDADAGPRLFGVVVTYREGTDPRLESGAIDVRANVAQRSPAFAVEPVNATFAAGESGELRVRVTNTREEAFSDISAKIYAEAPLSSTDDEAFIERLEPGESKTVVFRASAGGDALAKTYPVKLDFRYDDREGDTVISEVYQLPVRVTEPSGNGFSVGGIVGVVGLLVVGAAGFVYYRRR
jgi:hypothetical protein